VSYEETSRREESLIPNTQIESMFMRICTDDQMTKYTGLVEKGHISLATAYASNMVYKLFYKLVEKFEIDGGDIEQLGKEARKNGTK